MQLTRAQRINFELYAKYRSAPPTFWGLIRLNLWRYLLFIALLIVLFLLTQISGTESLALIGIGLFLGAVIRDIGRFRQFVQMWPALSAVMDWERLDVLLNQKE